MSWDMFVVFLGVGFTATYLWRFLGVLLADRLRSDMPFVHWVELVGYGLIAAIMARIAIMPGGPLEATPLWLRLAAIAFAVGLARFAKVGNLPAIICGAILFGLGLHFST